MQNAKCLMQNAKVSTVYRFAFTVLHFAFYIIFPQPLRLRASMVKYQFSYLLRQWLVLGFGGEGQREQCD